MMSEQPGLEMSDTSGEESSSDFHAEGLVLSADGQHGIAEYLYEAIGVAVEALDKTVFGDDFTGKTLVEILSRDGVDNDRDAIVFELLGQSTTLNAAVFLKVVSGYGYEWAVEEAKVIRQEMRRAGDVAVEMVSGPADLFTDEDRERSSPRESVFEERDVIPNESTPAEDSPLTEAMTFEEAGYHPLTDEELIAQFVPVPGAETSGESLGDSTGETVERVLVDPTGVVELTFINSAPTAEAAGKRGSTTSATAAEVVP